MGVQVTVIRFGSVFVPRKKKTVQLYEQTQTQQREKPSQDANNRRERNDEGTKLCDFLTLFVNILVCAIETHL